jgi:hypothetical protein
MWTQHLPNMYEGVVLLTTRPKRSAILVENGIKSVKNLHATINTTHKFTQLPPSSLVTVQFLAAFHREGFVMLLRHLVG